MDSYNVIGVMSGTSLDGLDIAFCSISIDSDKQWDFKINGATTTCYSKELEDKLNKSTSFSGLDLMLLDNELGDFIGNEINSFLIKEKIDRSQIDVISSHGHTIFHQPEKQLTVQIGNGANIAAITKLKVVCDYRTTDISLGGQGAPLVPIGDQLLFSNYDYCVNLGGIANISSQKNNTTIAYDICPVNIVMNKLALELGSPFDKSGEFAQTGNIDTDLLKQLNNLKYYESSPPKSLGIEKINKTVFPIINSSIISTENKLATFVEHIAIQIANNITTSNNKILFTGGGTFNSFLMERIKANTNNQITIPSSKLIDFKEALIFAFLGVLRLRNEVNCLKSVTGASKNNIGGCIYSAS
jgi:anhydro-N-acetylmuramic acid kinase